MISKARNISELLNNWKKNPAFENYPLELQNVIIELMISYDLTFKILNFETVRNEGVNFVIFQIWISQNQFAMFVRYIRICHERRIVVKNFSRPETLKSG